MGSSRVVGRHLSTIERHYKVARHVSKGEARNKILYNKWRIDTSKANTVACRKVGGLEKFRGTIYKENHELWIRIKEHINEVILNSQ